MDCRVSMYAEANIILEFERENDVAGNEEGDNVVLHYVEGMLGLGMLVMMWEMMQLVVSMCDTDDGMEDSDFSSEDEEHMEARRNLRWDVMAKSLDDDHFEATNGPPANWKKSNNGATWRILIEIPGIVLVNEYVRADEILPPTLVNAR
ncbi:conserved hypothetical protein [Ricinus communis]|uniref:Uncharacterized protein n=1 Tax=Ricinus communis TaxID=3988 RepID=B9SAK8_RICCO|nr:conserved hypothetical protein [Ricinus communis]